MALTPTILATGSCVTTATYTTPSGYTAYIKKLIITNTTEDEVEYAVNLVDLSANQIRVIRNAVLLDSGRCELENIILPALYSVTISGTFDYTIVGALEN